MLCFGLIRLYGSMALYVTFPPSSGEKCEHQCKKKNALIIIRTVKRGTVKGVLTQEAVSIAVYSYNTERNIYFLFLYMFTPSKDSLLSSQQTVISSTM